MRPKVNCTDAKAGSSSDHKTGPDRKTITPVLKVEPYTPAIQYQESDDEVEVAEGLTATPTYILLTSVCHMTYTVLQPSPRPPVWPSVRCT